MKESITKFDLEAAFKALDDIDMPIADKGIKANKPALTEIFSHKSKFDSLFEEYYDVGSNEELSDAKEAREAEVAKAKLARIEKIVDLDAESPEDLLTSYVGKFIIQCPQCMTLFYKNPEDVEESEDDENTVNVNEVCQHCGNETGYTLIGKVGEAVAEEVATEADEQPLDIEEESTDEVESEETVEGEAETSEEDFDLDGELEELDLDIEDEESTEANEALQPESSAMSLTEELTEDAELETSAEDFEKLINSSEFKKPISDNEARAMMQEFSDAEEANSVKEELTEAGLKDLGKALKNKVTQTSKNIKDKLAGAVDNLTDNLKSREEKADWILANALKDYSNAELDDGQIATDESNKRFKTFLVIGYAESFSNGKKIVSAPSYNNPDLVVGMNRPETTDSYKKADSIAKGWSQRQGNGPAFIYLAKDVNDDEATFLCEYFKGELENDQLEKYFNIIKKDLEGVQLTTDGGMDQSDYKQMPASEVKQGMKVRFDEEIAEVVKISQSRIGKKNLAIEVKFDDGATETLNISPETALSILKDSIKNESLDRTALTLSSFMEDLEELHESSLEDLISKALIETHEDIADFRLTDCSYLNEEFLVNGKVLFTSGITESTTYTFTEAYTTNEGQITLSGLNEKLDVDKQCTLTGNKADKTFIAESFNY